MKEKAQVKPSTGTPSSEENVQLAKKKRLEAALRANLKRRKSAAKVSS